MMIGTASNNKEKFQFVISPLSDERFRLDIRYEGDGEHNVTGAGIWPTVDKAREVAEAIARKQLSDVPIVWEDT